MALASTSVSNPAVLDDVDAKCFEIFRSPKTTDYQMNDSLGSVRTA